MYMTPRCWGPWVRCFESGGYRCLAPAWPGRDKFVEELRNNHPDPQLGRLTLSSVLEHMASVVRGLDEKPILVGHSMGGLIVQLLRQRDLAAASVAIDSAPPQLVFTTSWSFLRSNWPHINPFAQRSEPIEMTFKRFQYAFVNGLPAEEQRAAFGRNVVPESRRVPAESLTQAAHIDFRKPGSPLLFIAGSNDHIIPALLNRKNHARYHASGSTVDFKEFPGRTHFIIGQKGWEEVTGWVERWLENVG
jgi:pimeloyl-ACP methyl ester carboxylesterase